jgi:hypothetical protein
MKTLPIDQETEKLRDELLLAPDVHLFWNPGNLGDGLIRAGTRRLLNQIELREVQLFRDFDPASIKSYSGHTALIIGSGCWCHLFHEPLPRLLQEIEPRFEKTIILPSTFDVTEPTVRSIIDKTKAIVYARELTSYNGIADLCDAHLAHDFAFHFDFSTFIVNPALGALYCYREDADSAGDVPAGNIDISRYCLELDHWLWSIARYGEIWTDRAHVMIAAACMGRQVRYRSGAYFKVSAIAEYSLSEFDNVRPGLSPNLT